MGDIFISYASADRERARMLAKVLQRRGWAAWWDREIPPGKEYDQVIEEALDSSRCVVVLWSQASVASSWVKTEAAEAMRRKILVPALIEDVKIPLEFRRLQAADLSHWGGESDHPGLEEFFQSIDRKIQGSGVTEGPVTPAVPLPVHPPAPVPGRWTRPTWPTVAAVAALVGAASGLTFWIGQQDKAAPPGNTAPPANAQIVSPPAQEVGPSRPVPAAPDVVKPPEPVRQPPAADARVTDRPTAVTGPRPASREPPARVTDASNPPQTSKPAGVAPVEVKPGTPTALPQSPTAPPPTALPQSPATPPAAAPSESPTAPVRTTNLPTASPKQFEEIVLMVTKEGETEELETMLLFGDTSLVLKDEDSNIVRTLPYSSIQKATYSRTQRRIMLVRTTRHWLTLGVGREDIVLRLPDETHLLIMSQIEYRTGVKIVQRVD